MENMRRRRKAKVNRPAAPRGRRPNEQRKIDIATDALWRATAEEWVLRAGQAKPKYSRWTTKPQTRPGGALYETASQFGVTVRTVQQYIKEYRQQALPAMVKRLGSGLAAKDLLEKKADERKLAAIGEAFAKAEASGLTGDALQKYLHQLLTETREVK